MSGERPVSKSVLRKIRGMLTQFSSAEMKVAEYILDHPSETIRSSTEELAQTCDVSQASIIRFCQKLGYTGIKELKIFLAQEVGSLVPQLLTDPKRLSEIDYVHQVLAQTVEAIQRTVARVDDDMLHRAIDAIAEARIVDIYGAGESLVVGEHLQIKLRRLGIIANIYPNPHMQAISSASLRKGDVAIGISFSGCTQDTVDAMEFAVASGATTIAITNFPEFTPGGKRGDCVGDGRCRDHPPHRLHFLAFGAASGGGSDLYRPSGRPRRAVPRRLRVL